MKSVDLNCTFKGGVSYGTHATGSVTTTKWTHLNTKSSKVVVTATVEGPVIAVIDGNERNITSDQTVEGRTIVFRDDYMALFWSAVTAETTFAWSFNTQYTTHVSSHGVLKPMAITLGSESKVLTKENTDYIEGVDKEEGSLDTVIIIIIVVAVAVIIIVAAVIGYICYKKRKTYSIETAPLITNT